MSNKKTVNVATCRPGRIILLGLALLGYFTANAQPNIRKGGEGLVYNADQQGNKVPDYSYAGYKSSNEDIPFVAAKVFVSNQKGDQTERIQRAINHVCSLPIQANGFRGAVQLDSGLFELSGGLEINASGVVLRGAGVGKTTLLGLGLDRTTVIRVAGQTVEKLSNKSNITSAYVPVGANKFNLENANSFKIGDEVAITRPSTEEWIALLEMQEFGGDTDYIGWKPNERNIKWNRTITSINDSEITVDSPITTALDSAYGGGFFEKVFVEGRIENVGIENLSLVSEHDKLNPKDEQHRWMAITIEGVRDAWVRQVNFKHFAGSAVAIWSTASRITVEDCKSLEPVSEIGGQRRYTFFTEGQQCLFQRLYAEYGYHDFGVGFMAAGPNSFVECQSYLPNSFSGTIDSWASGVLFDIVNVDGQALRFGNRGMEAQGAGWTAANSMFWQCTASLVDCPAPPGAMNWAYAVWSQFSGNGEWFEENGFLSPRSLFYGQLADRLKTDISKRASLLPISTEATSSPTIEQAEEYVRFSNQPRLELKDWIDYASIRNSISTKCDGAISVDKIKPKNLPKKELKSIRKIGNRMFIGDQLATGAKYNVPWWRGNVRSYDAGKAGGHITRFVPGRVGRGLTDDLDVFVDQLKAFNGLIVDHNYGLWYDRRRDDHERIRRMNGEVWAPFYELPFARSGKETAWDGLSKYDLTKYNFWYWNRLSEFARKAEENGLVLYHQHYFQHNILEAGAHYADFPWRTANNINETPFAEPVNYAGDKRIFIADQFYNVSDPAHRKLHQAYIRKCLDNFKGQSNVIHFISEEYTGPLSFVEFWLDEIQSWMNETGEDPLIALSTTKDVQDAILQDHYRSKIVDIIDIKYWWYGSNKEDARVLYEPEGGKNLAPRQHARIIDVPAETLENSYFQTREYASKFPDKSISLSTPDASKYGWAVFFGGGSFMNIPKVAHRDFGRSVVKMSVDQTYIGSNFQLKDDQTGELLLYLNSDEPLLINLVGKKGAYQVLWINDKTGNVTEGRKVKGGYSGELDEFHARVLWLKKLK